MRCIAKIMVDLLLGKDEIRCRLGMGHTGWHEGRMQWGSLIKWS